MKGNHFEVLRETRERYTPISEKTWAVFKNSRTLLNLEKEAYFCRAGDLPQSFAFVYAGLLRAYVTDENGMNKHHFFQKKPSQDPWRPCSHQALQDSRFTIEALEASQRLQIHFKVHQTLLIAPTDINARSLLDQVASL